TYQSLYKCQLGQENISEIILHNFYPSKTKLLLLFAKKNIGLQTSRINAKTSYIALVYRLTLHTYNTSFRLEAFLCNREQFAQKDEWLYYISPQNKANLPFCTSKQHLLN